MNDEIKKEIRSIVASEIKSLKDEISFLSLPLISQYKILSWYGNADGVNFLTPAFDINLIVNRTIIIKSLQIIPYYVNNSVDFSFSDGTTETIIAGARIERLFDVYTNFALGAHLFRIFINDNQVPFQIIAEAGVPPPDFKVDNVFYKYPEKIQTIRIIYGTEVFESIVGAGTAIHPNVKIFMECYLI